MSAGHVLVCRLDNDGDVLLAGPAVRAVAAGADRVTLLCGPRGRRAAALLPGVDEVIVHRAAWIDPDGQPLDPAATRTLVDDLAERQIDLAVVLTSFHQSPLPTALLLRMAGVPAVTGISDDFPGTLLDVRHRLDDDVHEVERGLSLAAASGFRLPHGDDGRLAVRRSAADARAAKGLLAPLEGAPYVVVHPGASVDARAWDPARHAALVDALRTAGWSVVVTGGPDERALAGFVAGSDDGCGPSGGQRRDVVDLGGRTSLGALAEVLAGAAAVVVGNTGPAHLAAAVGAPVVSLFAATVPAVRWRPWAVPHELLGDQGIACGGCRAASCPVPGHPCLGVVTVEEVVRAVRRLVASKDHLLPSAVTRTPPLPWRNPRADDATATADRRSVGDHDVKGP
jgi:ADP-heptose:LPS heptosyltransferase